MSKKTKEEIAHEKKRDALIKEKPQEWEHIQKERQKIRQLRTEDALSDAGIEHTDPTVTFTQPAEGTQIGGMKAFNVEKGEEKIHTR